MRASGTYALLDGAWYVVAHRRREAVALYDEQGTAGAELPMARFERVEKVVTEASWRGGSVVVVEVDGGEVAFRTNDQGLADREGLTGQHYDGWVGRAAVAELSGVVERVLPQGGTREQTT